MEEIWKDIAGYENIYQISSLGNVKTVPNKITYSELHGTRHWKQRVLKQKIDKNGYKRVTLWKNKKSKDFLVHRLVALNFLPKLKGKEFVNHIDGTPSNNRVENPEWCTSRENLIHAFVNKLNQSPDPIILFDRINNKTLYFYSKAEASRFLDRSPGYVSGLLKQKKNEVDNYEIFVKGGN